MLSKSEPFVRSLAVLAIVALITLLIRLFLWVFNSENFAKDCGFYFSMALGAGTIFYVCLPVLFPKINWGKIATGVLLVAMVICMVISAYKFFTGNFVPVLS